MDYTTLTDTEINGMVMGVLSDGNQAYREGNGSAIELLRQVNSVEFGEHIEREEVYATFDPCNAPEDAWPIIAENKISIMWMTVETQWCATALGELEEGCWSWSYCPDHYFNDDKPLRAAMIVFLMMQESANVQDNPA